MTIFKSAWPDPELPKTSVFHYVFPQGELSDLRPRNNPDKLAYVQGETDRKITAGELETAVLCFATGLRKIGLRRGETVLLWGPNTIEWVIAAWACQAVGVCVSPANAAYGAKELVYQYNDSGSNAILLSPALLPIFEEARQGFHTPIRDERVVLVCQEENATSSKYEGMYALFGERAIPEKFADDQAHETAWMCYSSGTTGLPKGVMSSHYNFTSMLQSLTGAFELTKPTDILLGVLPLFHLFGLLALAHQPLTAGVPVILFGRFKEVAVLTAIEKYKITFGYVVPPILLALLHSAALSDFETSSIRALQSAAAPLAPELVQAFESKFPNCRVGGGYGLTESTGATSYWLPDSCADAPRGAVGKLLPTWELRLVDADGNDVPDGEPGELFVRGPCVMKGYRGKPEATETTMAPGGWLKTGDVGTCSADGWCIIVDRLKEMIKYKGFQVAPAELEALLLDHPSVADAGVIGVQCEEEATELPMAFIVPRTGLQVETQEEKDQLCSEVADWVKERVAHFKQLRGGVRVIDVIPRSPAGKILRRELRSKMEREVQEKEVKEKEVMEKEVKEKEAAKDDKRTNEQEEAGHARNKEKRATHLWSIRRQASNVYGDISATTRRRASRIQEDLMTKKSQCNIQ